MLVAFFLPVNAKMPGKSRNGFTRPITSYLGAEGDTEGSGKEGHEDIPTIGSEVNLQAIGDIVTRAMGNLNAEFKTLKEEVSKSLNTRTIQFDSKLNTISQK